MTTAKTGQTMNSLVRRAERLLGSKVVARDEEGHVIAQGGRESNGHIPPGEIDVPVRVAGQSAVVVVEQQGNEGVLPRQLVEGVIELLVNQIAVMDSLPNQDELKNQFIHRLLNGGVNDTQGALREGQILGMDLSRPRAVILVDASEYISGKTADSVVDAADRYPGDDWLRARFVIQRIVNFFSLPSDAICAYIGDGEIAVLKASSSRDLSPWAGRDVSEDLPTSWSNLSALKRAASELLRTLQREVEGEVSISVGRFHPGLTGLSRSYEDARTALTIGRRLSNGHCFYCLDELGMAALVGIPDDATRKELARFLLGPLERERELLDTLRVFFAADCSAAQAATKLFVHRNTLTYRFDKITSLTGLNPRRFHDATLLRLALMLCELTSAKPVQANS